MANKQKNTKRNALLTTLGAGAAKSLIGDLPKGAVDSVAEDATTRALAKKSIRPAFAWKNVKGALKARASGRALGGITAGTATFPVFASGIKDLKSGEKDKRNKGIAKVVGSGAAYGYGKGGIEGAWEAYVKKKPKWKKHFGTRGLARGVTSTAMASALALGLAHKMKKNQQATQQGKKSKSILPVAAAFGGVAGGLKGLSETMLSDARRSKQTFDPKFYRSMIKQPKKWLPKTVGRGVAGAFGTAVLGGVLAKLLKKPKGKKKVAFPRTITLLQGYDE